MPAENLTAMVEYFLEVVQVDPLTALLFVVGNVILLGSIAVFGVLVLGAVASLVRPA